MRIRRTPARALLVVVLACLATASTGIPVAGAGEVQAGSEDSVGLGVSPLQVAVEAKPGETSTHPITVTNTDDVAVTFTFSKQDFRGDKDEPEATPTLLGGEFQSAISGYDWITVPDPITIPAGQSRTVNVKVKTPSGATGGHYTAVIVTGGSRGAGGNVANSSIGVLFLMNAGGVPPPDIVITEINEVGPTRTETVYVNNGKTETTPTPVVEKDPVGPGPTRRVTGTCTTALPGGSGRCIVDESRGGGGDGGSGGGDGATVSVPGPVRQSLTLIPEDGKGTAARKELPTEWAGTWTSLLLPLVGLVLFVLYFLFLRRRRKDTEDEDPYGDDLGWDAPAPLT